MESIINTIVITISSIISFFGQKEIIGLCIGAVGSAVWYRVTGSVEQAQRNKQVAALIEGNVLENSQIAIENLGIVENEIKGLSNEKFTLDPLKDFIPTSADLLLLDSDFNHQKIMALWSSLKK